MVAGKLERVYASVCVCVCVSVGRAARGDEERG